MTNTPPHTNAHIQTHTQIHTYTQRHKLRNAGTKIQAHIHPHTHTNKKRGREKEREREREREREEEEEKKLRQIERKREGTRICDGLRDKSSGCNGCSPFACRKYNLLFFMTTKNKNPYTFAHTIQMQKNCKNDESTNKRVL